MDQDAAETAHSGRNSASKVTLVIAVILVALLASVLTVWLMTIYFFPTQFKPVQLNDREQQQLTAKLERFESLQPASKPRKPTTAAANQPLEPETYKEDDARREIRFNESELNALLANNTDLAQKLAIDLADDMASAKLLMPLDPEFPVLGGKTLKLSAGLELGYNEGRPVVVLRGLSLWGVPMPNAWLGGMKNVDLVREFGGDRGFWSAFADGVEYVKVSEGELHVKLKE